MLQPRKIAFLGTGLMGEPMAANLLAAGLDVTVWNRSVQKTERLGTLGAKVAAKPSEAVAGADVIISMLTDGHATGAILEEPRLQPALKGDAIWIDMSSAKPEHARAHAAMLRNAAVRHLDAPVSGGTAGASAGRLAIMAGGEQSTFDTALPVLEVMGRAVHVGPSGSGQLAKLANQAIVAIAIGAVAEAMLFLQAGGADPSSVRNALTGGFADSTILQQHGARMTNGDFAPGGTVQTQIKDLKNVLDEARSLGLELPSTHAIYARFQRLAQDLGGSGLDHSALFLELLDLNGSSAPQVRNSCGLSL